MKSLEDWLDIRSGEMRKVVLCAVGAFLLLSFVVLFQSIRKSLFLTYFDAKNLPYVTAGIACLSLPAVGLFAGLIERFHPWMVLQRILILLCAGLGLLWAFSEFIRVVTVLFYLWVTIGALLLTSGFWVLTAESFAVRGAKRLFGLITAGGTAGAMVTGLSLDWIAPDFESIHLMPILVAILILLYLVEYWMYRFLNVSDEEKLKDGGSRDNDSERGRFAGVPFLSNLSNNIGMIRKSPYLGSIAALVFVATVASSIVDYQFNEFAQIHIGRGDELAGFFGAFYGWTGCIALILQLALTSRVIRSAGVTFGLAVLPVFLLFGSTGFLVFPGLIVATLVRGGDNIFRKSLLRPVVEFLYVPIPAKVRRKTKTFIDSFVDSAGEGTGAAVVYVWVVIAGQHSRYLSVLVALLSLALFFLSWRMGKRYMDTIVSQLKSDDLKADQPDLPAGSHQPGFNVDLLAASFSRMDLQSMFIDMKTIGQTGSGTPVFRNEELSREHQKKSPRYQPAAPRDLASLLKSSDDTLIQKTLEDTNDWGEEWTPFLTRLLARDSIHKTVARTLAGMGDSAVPELAAVLNDESADFVIRRRIPRILAGIGGSEVEKALLQALFAGRFEIRYRTVVALVYLNKKSLHVPEDRLKTVVWDAIRNEVQSSRPVWEMRRLLDSLDSTEHDKLITRRIDARSSLSLEHTFRMLTLILDPKPVAAALHGILSDDESFKSFALEYLEHTLPTDIKNRLWVFIGDVSEARRQKEARPLRKVVSDLMSSRATLFHDGTDRDVLERMLRNEKK